jgi:hypothetical protein
MFVITAQTFIHDCNARPRLIFKPHTPEIGANGPGEHPVDNACAVSNRPCSGQTGKNVEYPTANGIRSRQA